MTELTESGWFWLRFSKFFELIFLLMICVFMIVAAKDLFKIVAEHDQNLPIIILSALAVFFNCWSTCHSTCLKNSRYHCKKKINWTFGICLYDCINVCLLDIFPGCPCCRERWDSFNIIFKWVFLWILNAVAIYFISNDRKQKPEEYEFAAH